VQELLLKPKVRLKLFPNLKIIPYICFMSRLEKLLFKTIDKQICGVDLYTKDKSFWLIFTDDKKWVIEFISSSGNLWYNYLFFEKIFTWLGIKDNKNDLIKKWFESRFLGINEVENTIQNGVRATVATTEAYAGIVENTIQNGVRSTKNGNESRPDVVENTIQNGVRSTMYDSASHLGKVKNAIQNGVKNTEEVFPFENDPVEDIIQNGIIISRSSGGVSCGRIEDTIQNGVRSTMYVLQAIWEKLRMPFKMG